MASYNAWQNKGLRQVVDVMSEDDLRKERGAIFGSSNAEVTHVFNHQTHHRGQIHAMVTAAGHALPATDLVFMPEP